jgi:2-polyprenyl-3-methyl-5-hydroxy-6-metoxy-1,4-benzoquinol methylase
MAVQPRYPHSVTPDPSHPAKPPDLTQLGQKLQTAYVELGSDDAQREFIVRSQTRPHSWLLTMTHRIVRSFMSDYDANGLLGMYPMHLLSSTQWRLLLELEHAATLLDVGAGDGGLTRHLAPLFTSITTTETSPAMARRLRKRGYECLVQDLSEHPLQTAFDCVTCLNVVDRTSKPRDLIERLSRLVAPGGRLVLAVPLPIRAFYYLGPRTLEPTQALHAHGPSWERAAMQLATTVSTLAPDFELTRWSKASYLSWGDHARTLYSLEDFVGVWQRQ